MATRIVQRNNVPIMLLFLPCLVCVLILLLKKLYSNLACWRNQNGAAHINVRCIAPDNMRFVGCSAKSKPVWRLFPMMQLHVDLLALATVVPILQAANRTLLAKADATGLPLANKTLSFLFCRTDQRDIARKNLLQHNGYVVFFDL